MSIDIEELTERKASETFPNIVIPIPNDNIPVVIKSLEKGDMQLIVEFKGKRKVVARISESALNIDKLIRTVGEVTYCSNSGSSVEVRDVTTYLNCIV